MSSYPQSIGLRLHEFITRYILSKPHQYSTRIYSKISNMQIIFQHGECFNAKLQHPPWCLRPSPRWAPGTRHHQRPCLMFLELSASSGCVQKMMLSYVILISIVHSYDKPVDLGVSYVQTNPSTSAPVGPRVKLMGAIQWAYHRQFSGHGRMTLDHLFSAVPRIEMFWLTP